MPSWSTSERHRARRSESTGIGLGRRCSKREDDTPEYQTSTVEKTSVSVSQAEKYAEAASGHDAIVQTLGKDGLRIQVATIDTKKADEVSAQLAKDLGVPQKDINGELVGPSWGDQIASGDPGKDLKPVRNPPPHRADLRMHRVRQRPGRVRGDRAAIALGAEVGGEHRAVRAGQ